MRRFSNIVVSAARYKITRTTAKMFAKCADFHILESLWLYEDTPFLDKKLTRKENLFLLWIKKHAYIQVCTGAATFNAFFHSVTSVQVYSSFSMDL